MCVCVRALCLCVGAFSRACLLVLVCWCAFWFPFVAVVSGSRLVFCVSPSPQEVDNLCPCLQTFRSLGRPVHGKPDGGADVQGGPSTAIWTAGDEDIYGLRDDLFVFVVVLLCVVLVCSFCVLVLVCLTRGQLVPKPVTHFSVG